MKKITLAVLLIALLSGCSTADKLNDVRIGMTKQQVITLLGTADSTSAQANIEYLTYYLSNDGNGRDRPYSVRLVDGKVESFGRFTQLFDIYNRPITGSPQMMGMGMGVAPMTGGAPIEDLARQIQRLKMLKDQGVLTDEEFQKAKQKLLSDPK